jgi:lipid-A-disaccharide synthase
MISVMILAGEASGDQRGGEVAKALRTRLPDCRLTGIGGQQMQMAGVELFCNVDKLSVMGFSEVIKHLPQIYKIFKRTQQKLREEAPDLLILVDYPGFNLRIARYAKSIGIKTLFYISPQVWAWRQNRVKKIAASVDHMAVIFPFEKKFYERYNLPVTFVGHPLTQTIQMTHDRANFRKMHAIPEDAPLISFLPGSRLSEVHTLLPLFVAAMPLIREAVPNARFALALASTIDMNDLAPIIGNNDILIVQKNTYDLMHAADLVITASGTATLETALIGTPMIVVYKVNAITGWIAKRLIKIPYISLCNIVAEEKVVEELLQEKATPQEIAFEAIDLLSHPEKLLAIRRKLSPIREKLGHEKAADNMAQLVIDLVG